MRRLRSLSITSFSFLVSRSRWSRCSFQEGTTPPQIREGRDALRRIRARVHGIVKAPLITEPTAMLVKRYPKWEALRCNSFKPTTGINDGIIEIKNENSFT
jgi:hypothetical protein